MHYKTSNTDRKVLLSSPKFNNFMTMSDKNNWDSLYFHKKVYKNTLDLLKVTQNPPSPWLNVVSSLKKPCQAVETRNEQTDLLPTLKKGGGCASLTIFVTDCRYVPITSETNESDLYCSLQERQQLPLKIAWAITILKSQWFIMDKAWVGIGKSEKFTGLTYIGLSREWKLLGSLKTWLLNP